MNNKEKSSVVESQSDTAKVGRGVLWLTVAKAWYMISGMALLMIFPRIGGGTDEERAALFGTYSVVVGVINPVTMMLILGTLQAVSKFVSEKTTRYKAVLKTAIKMQFALGLLFSLLFYLAAPLVSRFLDDSALVEPLRIASVIIFFYAMYPVFIGGFNGTKRFTSQASMDICFATLKISLILGAVYFGFGIKGAIGGFAATAIIMTTVSALLTLKYTNTNKRTTNDISVKKLFKFEFWILIFAFLSNLLLNADILIVKSMSDIASEVGVYSAALQIARLPYVAVISVTFVLFPIISKATWSEDMATARNYIFTASRYSIIIVGLLAITLAACSEDVLRLVFPPLFVAGRYQLSFLAMAYMEFSVLAIFTTVITASGRPQASTVLISLTLLASGVFTWLGMNQFGTNGAAAGVLLAMGLGAVSATVYLHRWIKAKFPVKTFVRILLVGATIFAASMLWHPDNKILIVAKGITIFSIYVALLFVTKEFTRSDFAKFSKVFARK